MSFDNISYSLEDAIKIIREYSLDYQTNLVNRIFAYAFVKNNKIFIYEVKFHNETYLHLTGMDFHNNQYLKRKGISEHTHAQHFWEMITDNSNTIDQLKKHISFIHDEDPEQKEKNRQYACRKIYNLGRLVNIANKAKYIREPDEDNTFHLMINRELISLKLIKVKEYFVPKSSIHTGKNQNRNKFIPVLAIFTKSYKTDKYRIMYINKDAKINENTSFDLSIIDKFNLDSFAAASEIKLNEKMVNSIINSYKNGIVYELNKTIRNNLDILKRLIKDKESYTEIEDKINDFVIDVLSLNENSEVIKSLIMKYKFPKSEKMVEMRNAIIGKIESMIK